MVAACDGQADAPRAAAMERAAERCGRRSRTARPSGGRRSTRCWASRPRTGSACGSTSSGCRRRGPGSAAARTSSGSRRTGSGRRRSSGDPLEHLVARYLRAFGPGVAQGRRELHGLKLGDLKPALAALELERYASEYGRGAARRPGRPLPGGDVAAPVRFLPTWDAALLVHARRTQVLPERFRPLHLPREEAAVRARRSSSTARWPGRGGTRTGRSGSSRSSRCRTRCSTRSARPRSRSPRSTPEGRAPPRPRPAAVDAPGRAWHRGGASSSSGRRPLPRA